MSWVYELLKNRYERKWYPPWKPSDYILWQFGPLRPKGYGEILFSDEYNYIIYTLYWSKVSKRFFFRGLFQPALTVQILRFAVTIPPIIFRTFKFPGLVKTDFADAVLQIIAIKAGTDFADVINRLLWITRKIALSGERGTLTKALLSASVELSLSNSLVNDAPTRGVRIHTEAVDISKGVIPPNLYLDIIFGESIQKAGWKYADAMTAIGGGVPWLSAGPKYADIVVNLIKSISTPHFAQKQIEIKTFEISTNISVQ